MYCSAVTVGYIISGSAAACSMPRTCSSWPVSGSYASETTSGDDRQLKNCGLSTTVSCVSANRGDRVSSTRVRATSTSHGAAEPSCTRESREVIVVFE